MTSFARYYTDNRLYDFSMSDIKLLITDEVNKEKLADIIYNRYYSRYLKLFYFTTPNKKQYTQTVEGRDIVKELNEYNTEFKSGFAIMTNCCLLIETIATYFEGQNASTKSGTETFNIIFRKANDYQNDLKKFENKAFYKNIRCGLLHQGETYGKFRIRRTGVLFDETNFVINANLFCDKLNDFLKSYREELKMAKWDSELWDKCRVKLRHIIQNSNF
ncbi:hypothetical protein [Pedobacter glucosidilyticus]|uniref:hypothetical protein n=1 Tax=Pedobacter glucosidilyticus TaxID=1122941 RepID=UPI0026F329D9|nr:hypothetical protein [Pedobacter glucosidilyticus]